MAHEVYISSNSTRIIVNDAKNINKITNQIDIAAGKAVPAFVDEDVITVDETVFPP